MQECEDHLEGQSEDELISEAERILRETDDVADEGNNEIPEGAATSAAAEVTKADEDHEAGEEQAMEALCSCSCLLPQSIFQSAVFTWHISISTVVSQHRFVAQVDGPRADAGGSHAAALARGRVQGSWPPGARPYFGAPKESSEFIQAYLPAGWKHEGKKSKSLSFCDAADGPRSSRSAACSKEAAVMAVQGWAWEWWASLTSVQQLSIREAHREEEPGRPLKRPRV